MNASMLAKAGATEANAIRRSARCWPIPKSSATTTASAPCRWNTPNWSRWRAGFDLPPHPGRSGQRPRNEPGRRPGTARHGAGRTTGGGRAPRRQSGAATAVAARDPHDAGNVFLEIRAGTGGDEPRCSPAICCACMRVMPNCVAGPWKFSAKVSASTVAGGSDQPASSVRALYSRLKFESRRAPGAAGTGHRGAGSHSYLRRHRGGAA